MHDAGARRTAILTQFVVRPSSVAEFDRLLRSTSRYRAGLPDAVCVHPLQDSQAPWRFTLVEIYEGSVGVAARATSGFIDEWSRSVRPLLIQEREEIFSVIGLPDQGGANRE